MRLARDRLRQIPGRQIQYSGWGLHPGLLDYNASQLNPSATMSPINGKQAGTCCETKMQNKDSGLSWSSISLFKVTLHFVWFINRSYMANTCSIFALLYCPHLSVVFCCCANRWLLLVRLLCRRVPSLVMYQHGFCSCSSV